MQVRQSGWKRGEPKELLLQREWLVTNGLGGYASGTVGGACTRRFHGQLIAALPAPLGRTMMFNHIEEVVEGPAGLCWRLSGDEHGGGKEVAFPEAGFLEEFSLEAGRPPHYACACSAMRSSRTTCGRSSMSFTDSRKAAATNMRAHCGVRALSALHSNRGATSVWSPPRSAGMSFTPLTSMTHKRRR